MAAFDFTATMDAIGKIFTRGLKRRIENQVGIDGAHYSYPKASTLKRRKVGKIGTKRAAAVNIKRLHVTRDTANRGFGHTPDSSGVTIFVSSGDHMSANATYRDIIRWNSRGQPVVNPYIVNPPLVFPTKEAEVNLMKAEMGEAGKKLHLDVVRQLREKGIVRAKVVLNIG